MKRTAVLLLACTVASLAAADQTPQSFLGSLPDLPGRTCQVTLEERKIYEARLAEAREPLDQEIARRKQLRAEQNREMQKSKPKLTKVQKDALADKMLQEKLGISLEEVRKMKQMSKAGRKAWAESVATEQMAVASADPAAAKADQEKNLKMLELTKELQFRQSEFAAAAEKHATQLEDLHREFEEESGKNAKADEEEAERREASGSGNGDIPPPKNYHYCERYSPRYKEIVNQFRFFVVGVLPACQRLEKLEYEMLKATIEQANTGNAGNLPALPIPPEPACDGGLRALEAIRDYFRLLNGAYKYDVDPRPSDSGSSGKGETTS
jgi:hypothetical protein